MWEKGTDNKDAQSAKRLSVGQIGKIRRSPYTR